MTDLLTMAEQYAHVRKKSRGRRRPDDIKYAEAIDKLANIEVELERLQKRWHEARRVVRYYERKVAKANK
jgi:hypothetical protein